MNYMVPFEFALTLEKEHRATVIDRSPGWAVVYVPFPDDGAESFIRDIGGHRVPDPHPAEYRENPEDYDD